MLNMDLRENLWTEEEAEADDWLQRKMLVVFLNDYYLKKCTLVMLMFCSFYRLGVQLVYI